MKTSCILKVCGLFFCVCIAFLTQPVGHQAVILSEEDTPLGAVETFQDAEKCAKLFKDNSECIDGILVILPNFGDEVGVSQALSMAKLNVPILIQACDDDMNKMDSLHLLCRTNNHRHKLHSQCHSMLGFCTEALWMCYLPHHEYAR